jgi:hypothetical protein
MDGRVKQAVHGGLEMIVLSLYYICSIGLIALGTGPSRLAVATLRSSAAPETGGEQNASLGHCSGAGRMPTGLAGAFQLPEPVFGEPIAFDLRERFNLRLLVELIEPSLGGTGVKQKYVAISGWDSG